ncbi:glutamate ABC transporter substrate-binding protein [Streptomyces sp. NPDC004959]|uniref:glutamate ABC transporter substrate-binding protein n=1 Tax=Streptomyces sp. NPDC004959 TaxID=3154673 RepID=UPI0033B6D706
MTSTPSPGPHSREPEHRHLGAPSCCPSREPEHRHLGAPSCCPSHKPEHSHPRKPAHPHPREPRRRSRAAVLLLALLCLLAAACGKEGSPPAKGPSAAELPRYRVDTGFRLPASTTWRKAKARGRLVVGAKEDQPYLGEKDPASGRYSGFDIEIAKMVAAGLGFPANRVTFRTIASANRETSLQNGQIDYYVGTYTINANRKKLVGFAGPYYMAGQGLLVRKDENGIKGPADLDGKRVCSAAGSTPYQRIQHDYPEAHLVSYDTYSICVDNLLTYQVDAVTTDDSILLGYAAKVPEELKVVGKPFSKEPYGIGVPRRDNALRLAIDGILAARERDGTWKKAYDATLGLSGVPAPKPPPIDRYPAP